LNGANTFTGGITIKAGTLPRLASSATTLWDGTIILGDSAGGSAAAILRVGARSASSAAISITTPSSSRPTHGALEVNSASSAGATTLTGGVTGPNNFWINTSATGGGTITFSVNPINNAGTLTIGRIGHQYHISISGGSGRT